MMVGTTLAYTTSSNLVQINDKNFQELVIKSGKYVFVDFYADWCRHCKNLMPIIEELADLFEPYNDQVQVYKINGDKDGKRMGKKHVFIGYPTMKLFHGSDEPIEFDGNRDLKSLSNFIQQISGVRLEQDSITNKEEIVGAAAEHASKVLVTGLNDYNFEEQVLKAKVKSVVVFSATWCQYCQELEPIIEDLARNVYDRDNNTVQFGKVVIDKEPSDIVSEQFGVEHLPTVMFFDPLNVDADGLRRPFVYKGKNNERDLIKAINEYTGLDRDGQGRLSTKAGLISHFDDLIQQRLRGIVDNKRSVAIELLSDLNKVLAKREEIPLGDLSMASYYKKLMNKVINGEDQFFNKELERLANIMNIDGEKLPRKTLDSMKMRSNILQVFLAV